MFTAPSPYTSLTKPTWPNSPSPWTGSGVFPSWGSATAFGHQAIAPGVGISSTLYPKALNFVAHTSALPYLPPPGPQVNWFTGLIDALDGVQPAAGTDCGLCGR